MREIYKLQDQTVLNEAQRPKLRGEGRERGGEGEDIY